MAPVDRSMSQYYLNDFMGHAISKKQADDPALDGLWELYSTISWSEYLVELLWTQEIFRIRKLNKDKISIFVQMKEYFKQKKKRIFARKDRNKE